MADGTVYYNGDTSELAMASAPGIDFLPEHEQQLFAQEFQKDAEFMNLLVLMISRACATGSVDITWTDRSDSLRQVIGTTQAAKAPCSRYLNWDRQDPSQRFCNIVSDSGRRAAESCAACENAAERRVGASGRAQVYRCHAGLTDIAVPVIAGGRHIATLYSGQVLSAPPSAAAFQRVAADIRHLAYIDLAELERAYWEVPVISEQDIANTVRILEMFAEFLARFWKRLGEAVGAERQEMRTRQLAGKEFAYMLLQAAGEDRPRLCRLLEQLGFAQPPNRVLVVKLQAEEEFDTPSVSFDLMFTSALQAIEEVAERNKNVAVAYLRRRGVCVFFRELTEGASAGLRGRGLARKILDQISRRCDISARIGIGGTKRDWQNLAESYHEAMLALTESADAIASSADGASKLFELTSRTELACQQLADHRVQDARVTLRGLPIAATHRLAHGDVGDHRTFFISALESISLTAMTAGCDSQAVARLRAESQQEIVHAATAFDVHAAFLEGAESITEEVRRLLIGKHEKLMARARQMIDRELRHGRGGESLSLAGAAQALGLSTGHLSRLFRRMNGATFREYVTARRIEYARRLLLDPLNNVSLVSERCGFSSPAYFARVFRKVAGCAPAEYARNPRLAEPRA